MWSQLNKQFSWIAESSRKLHVILVRYHEAILYQTLPNPIYNEAIDQKIAAPNLIKFISREDKSYMQQLSSLTSERSSSTLFWWIDDHELLFLTGSLHLQTPSLGARVCSIPIRHRLLRLLVREEQLLCISVAPDHHFLHRRIRLHRDNCVDAVSLLHHRRPKKQWSSNGREPRKTQNLVCFQHFCVLQHSFIMSGMMRTNLQLSYWLFQIIRSQTVCGREPLPCFIPDMCWLFSSWVIPVRKVQRVERTKPMLQFFLYTQFSSVM